MAKLWVGGLPPGIPDRDVEDVFAKYGRLRNCWVARKPPGFGFVEFEDRRDAEDAVKALDNGRQGWKVEFARSAGPRIGPAGGFRSEDRYGGGGAGYRGRSPSPRRRSPSPPRRRRSPSYDRQDARRSRSRSPRRERRRSPSPRRRSPSPRRRDSPPPRRRDSRSPPPRRDSRSPRRERRRDSRSPPRDSPVRRGRSASPLPRCDRTRSASPPPRDDRDSPDSRDD